MCCGPKPTNIRTLTHVRSAPVPTASNQIAEYLLRAKSHRQRLEKNHDSYRSELKKSKS